MKISVTKELQPAPYEVGREVAKMRILYRIDPDVDGQRQMGDVHQYPPIAIPRSKLGQVESDRQLVAQMDAYPNSDFFEIEIAF